MRHRYLDKTATKRDLLRVLTALTIRLNHLEAKIDLLIPPVKPTRKPTFLKTRVGSAYQEME